MAAVFPQMNGDTVRPGGYRGLADGERVRMEATPRVAQGGDMVNINAQPDMFAHRLNM
jgi:hypothetical protein